MNIFYGIAGEGMCHAGRSMTLIDELLTRGHTVEVFTSNDAYKLFEVSKLPVKLHRIPSIVFALDKKGGVALARSCNNFRKLLKEFNGTISEIANKGRANNVGLFITDFEPVIPRVAIELNVPCVSVDNQHKFLLRQKGLPISLQLYAGAVGIFTKWFIPKIDKAIVATFHQCYGQTKKYVQSEILIRNSLVKIKPTKEDYVLVYLKPYLQNQILRVLSHINEKFIVYGTKNLEIWSNDQFTFKSLSNDEFARDLAHCKAVICTAGNQLIGESKFFSKPVFAIPVPKQDEQKLNAFCVRQEGFGDFSTVAKLTTPKIENFLHTNYQIKPVKNGLEKVITELEEYGV